MHHKSNFSRSEKENWEYLLPLGLRNNRFQNAQAGPRGKVLTGEGLAVWGKMGTRVNLKRLREISHAQSNTQQQNRGVVVPAVAYLMDGGVDRLATGFWLECKQELKWNFPNISVVVVVLLALVKG